MTHTRRRNWTLTGTVIAIGLVLLGCKTQGIQRIYHNPYPQQRSLAVVPFKNQSGSQVLDVIAATDEFVTELQQVHGLQVIPVNRVLAKLSDLGMDTVETPEDVMALADALGTDGVIVGSITRYEPYPPPMIGMTIQLYIRKDFLEKEQNRHFHIDPAELAQAAKPYELGSSSPIKLLAMATQIVDARQDRVVQRLKNYANSRNNDPTPLAWKRYTTQRNYLRFVSHELIGELLAQEQARLFARNKGE